MTDRSEASLTEIVDKVARADWERIRAAHVAQGDNAWPEFDDLSSNHQVTVRNRVLSIVWDTLTITDAEPHKAKRGDEVEAYIKRFRDGQYDSTENDVEDLEGDRLNGYQALDEMLNDYRLHADTGTPLTESAHPESELA